MERPTTRSYKIRGTRITAGQREAKKALQLVYGIRYKEEIINPRDIFPTAKRFIMEIGFGMGEATALIAAGQSEDGFFAVDLHPPGIGKLLGRIEEEGLTNLRVIEEDVHVVLPAMFADKSLDGIHLFFPDPWPKTKHNKRRIVNSNFLELIAPKLKVGGYVHIATDWVPYAIWIEDVFSKSNLFSGGTVTKPNWRPVTRFESQGIDKDHRVTDLLYLRN